jgi:hypothetical protein
MHRALAFESYSTRTISVDPSKLFVNFLAVTHN